MFKIIKLGCLLLFIVLVVNLIGPFHTNRQNLGGKYVYNPNGRDISGPIDIPSKIIEFSCDDNHIVATQKLRTGMYPLEHYNIGHYNGLSLDQYDHDGDGVVYWIVNIKTNRNILCGDRREFEEICDSIGVSGNLRACITY